MDKLHFATGGFPHTTKGRNIFSAMERIKELGLDAMELEFTHSTWLKPEHAVKVSKRREELSIQLTVHGPYYVNLAAIERQKQHASISYVEKAAKIGDLAGAYSVTFHPAAYLKRDSKEVYEITKKNLAEIMSNHDKSNQQIFISPELTGKPTQFGDLDELIRLSRDIPGLKFCLDFSHKHARSNGQYNSYDDFSEMLDSISKKLGSEFLKDMHMHVSGIHYSEKGESHHVNFLSTNDEYKSNGVEIDGWENVAGFDHRYVESGADMKWKDLLKALKDFGVAGVLVCESPNLEQDALLMKKYFESL